MTSCYEGEKKSQNKTQALKTSYSARGYGTHDALDLNLGGCNWKGKEALGPLE